jgi:SagB-type dehydrogenase family enzyme
MRPSRRALYRRSATLVVYWRQGRAVASDYARRSDSEIKSEDLSVLEALDGWTSLDAVERAIGHLSSSAIRSSIDRLVAAGFVHTSGQSSDRIDALRSWRSWSPHAAFFHFGTRDHRHVGLEQAERAISLKRLFGDPPRPLKNTKGGSLLRLPAASASGAFPDVLLNRRSWRRFGTAALTRNDLSTLLGLTWGVQRWMVVGPGIRSALKTSPSGGACHSLEAYVIAQRVEGLRRGIYHYAPDHHALRLVSRKLPPAAVSDYLCQPWYGDSAAAFVMTSVWSRVQWKYGFSRAYRTVLLEAGHFAQTFCLLATWLGLAPFCSASFDDAAIETALGIDGVSEGAIYVTGVGERPARTTWAPWPDPADTPQTIAPRHLKRRTGGVRRRK